MQSFNRDLADVDGISPDRREEILHESEQEVRKSAGAFTAVAMVRVEWLVARVVGLDPANADLKTLADR
jgi:hypothetical protein